MRKREFLEEDGDRFISVKEGTSEVWIKEGDPKIYKKNPGLALSLSSDEDQVIFIKVHYRRFDESYDEWNLWLWPEGKDGKEFDFVDKDDFGVVLETTLTPSDSDEYGFIVRKGEWEVKDVDEDRFIFLGMLRTEY